MDGDALRKRAVAVQPPAPIRIHVSFVRVLRFEAFEPMFVLFLGLCLALRGILDLRTAGLEVLCQCRFRARNCAAHQPVPMDLSFAGRSVNDALSASHGVLMSQGHCPAFM